MELDEIRAFIAVADVGSISVASRKLHLAQPTVTRQIQRLEASLGAKLLDRRTKPITLTSTGHLVLDHCRRVLTSLEDLQAASTPPGPAGELRIGVSQALSDIALAKPVDYLRQTFPKVLLSITTGWSHELVEAVRSGRLDAAFVLLPDGSDPPSGLEGWRLGMEPLVAVASRRSRIPGVLDLEDLTDVPWVLNPSGCGFRATLERALRGVNAALRVAVEVHGTELQLSLVARGIGLGLVPARVFARSRLHPRLRIVRIRRQALRLGVWIVSMRPPERLLPAVDVLREALEAVYAKNGIRSRTKVNAATA